MGTVLPWVCYQIATGMLSGSRHTHMAHTHHIYLNNLHAVLLTYGHQRVHVHDVPPLQQHRLGSGSGLGLGLAMSTMYPRCCSSTQMPHH